MSGPARLSIRPKRYRGQDGFLVTGRDSAGRSTSIWTPSRASAEHIRDKKKAGQQLTPADYWL